MSLLWHPPRLGYPPDQLPYCHKALDPDLLGVLEEAVVELAQALRRTR